MHFLVFFYVVLSIWIHLQYFGTYFGTIWHFWNTFWTCFWIHFSTFRIQFGIYSDIFNLFLADIFFAVLWNTLDTIQCTKPCGMTWLFLGIFQEFLTYNLVWFVSYLPWNLAKHRWIWWLSPRLKFHAKACVHGHQGRPFPSAPSPRYELRFASKPDLAVELQNKATLNN